MLVHTYWRENCGPATYVKLLDGGVVGVIASEINQDPDFQAYMHQAENFAEVESRGPHSYYGAWGMKEGTSTPYHTTVVRGPTNSCWKARL